ncbi:hypothetical protein EYZ60_11400 [Escherichia coli]|nr:hypothetical protein [Escherichia coli]EFH9105790.1 hypothetical protein [Escherichia coli]
MMSYRKLHIISDILYIGFFSPTEEGGGTFKLLSFSKLGTSPFDEKTITLSCFFESLFQLIFRDFLLRQVIGFAAIIFADIP